MKRKLLLLIVALYTSGLAFGQYCAADGGGDEYISGVEIGTINNTGTGADGYHDYTALSTDLFQGQTGVSITITNGNGYANDDVGVWIDWNQNNDFTDADENVVCDADGGGQGTFTFNVPAGATLGNTVMRVRIKWSGSDCGSPCGSTSYGEVEDYTINVTTAPSCVAPGTITVTSFTTTTADLAWTQVSGSTGYDWEVVASGGTPGTGSSISSGSTASGTDTTATATGLSANTTYDAYVQNDCGSTWTGPSTFTTQCNAISTFPYTEDFATWPPDCWTIDMAITGSTNEWIAYSSGGGTDCAEANFWGQSNGKTDIMYTPTFDVSGLTTPSLKFDWSHSYNSTYPDDSLSVEVSDDNGGTWHQVWGKGGSDLDSQDGADNTTPGSFVTTSDLDLSAYGTSIMIRFYATSGYGPNLFIDNVVVREMPSCFDPTDQAVSNKTITGADLDWTDASGSYWDVYVVAAGGAAPVQGTTPTANDVTTHPYTWTGGASGTTYDWYVRSDCDQDNTGTSAWVGPNTFTTLQTAAPVQSMPFTEDWETNIISNSFWNWDAGSVSTIQTSSASVHNGTYGLEQYGNSSTGYSTPTSLADAYTKAQTGGTNENWTTWNKMSIDLSSATSPWLSFWYAMGYIYNNNYNNFWVQVSTDGSTWTDLFSTQTNGGAIAYEKKEFNLSAYNGTAQLYIRFFHNGKYNSNYLYLDDIKVQEVTCPTPTDQAETNVSGFQADLGWTENGSATTWEIRIDTAGFDTTGYAVETVTNNPYTKTGLSPTTTYDWYVRSSCGGGDYSEWIGPKTFTTTVACPAPTDQTETSITTTSADLGWTENGTATAWEIRIDTAGFDTTGYAVETASANPYTKTGLTAGTSYDWYVRSDCGSDWAGPHTFTTYCNAENAFPYTESFETAVPPQCWTEDVVNYDGTGTGPDWSYVSTGTYPTCSPVDGSNMAKFNSFNCSSGDEARLYTVQFDFTGLTGMVMSFWMYHDNGYSSYTNEGVQVQVSTDGATWSNLGNFIKRTSASNGWSKHTFDLSAYDGEASVYIGFLSHSEWGNNIYIDGVTVHNNAPATTTWSGSTDTNWYDVDNWSTTDIPYPNTDVTIPVSGITNYPTIGTPGAVCNNLTIESNSSGNASIIGDNNLTVGGSATVQRYLTGGMWHDFSASTQGQTLNAAYFGGSPDVWLTHYNEPDDSRTYLTTLTDPLDVGAGYEIWVEAGSNVTVDFTGALQTADVALTTTSTPALSFTDASHGYNLIGNPFASPIALDSGAWGMANVDSTFWVWDPDSTDGATIGAYRDYNTLAKVGSLAGGIIPMGQGFFIHANAASPTFTIPIAARVHSSQAYYKNTRSNDLTKMSLRAYYNTDYYDELNVAFIAGANELFEGYDTRKMFAFNGDAPQVYSIITDEELSLNSLPTLNPGDQQIVDVGYKAGVNGNQTLVADLSSLDETSVVLEDLRINKFQSLNDNPVYTFDATTYQDPYRFKLHFNRSVTGINEDESSSDMRAYAIDKNLFIVSKGDLINQTKMVSVFDIMGRKVIDKTISKGEMAMIPLRVSDAYVVVRVISNNKVYTTKVFIK